MVGGGILVHKTLYIGCSKRGKGAGGIFLRSQVRRVLIVMCQSKTESHTFLPDCYLDRLICDQFHNANTTEKE